MLRFGIAVMLLCCLSMLADICAQSVHLAVAHYAFDEMPAQLLNNRTISVMDTHDHLFFVMSVQAQAPLVFGPFFSVVIGIFCCLIGVVEATKNKLASLFSQR